MQCSYMLRQLKVRVSKARTAFATLGWACRTSIKLAKVGEVWGRKLTGPSRASKFIDWPQVPPAATRCGMALAPRMLMLGTLEDQHDGWVKSV